MHDPRFGLIAGVPIGKIFENRHALYAANIHTRIYAGISGSKNEGAFSIVVSGSYEDNRDSGDTLEYTGTGGQKNSFSKPGAQTYDQSFDHQHNRALQRSFETRKPVRVIRGPNANPKFAPASGYRYDGLYVVTDAYLTTGTSGFKVCKYELERLSGQPALPSNW
ncbi:SRA-YDG [Pluteus cervinus]|uniref:SRA-YDG n=1 Tax=Pluteus cervinus TaxID=181527 RepID=A0ACD3AT80_9AGAR|nr:SRA-YDG [Pluteus cervinus]